MTPYSKKQQKQRCDHYEICIAVCEYGLCANEDPTYNNPKQCKYDSRFCQNNLTQPIDEPRCKKCVEFQQEVTVQMVESAARRSRADVLELYKDFIKVRIAQGISGISVESLIAYLSNPDAVENEINGICAVNKMSLNQLKEIADTKIRLKSISIVPITKVQL